jgi:hypothetical protein
MLEAALVNDANCYPSELRVLTYIYFVFSLPEVSDQNFSEDKVNVEANDEPHKKRKPTSRVVPNDQST